MHKIDVVINPNQTYLADNLYQWNKFNRLNIYGVSFGNAPEIHFSKVGMSEALVKHSDMNAAGVVSCVIPNQLLESSGKLDVYVCNYCDDEFKTYYHLELQIIGRTKPADYLSEDDEFIYSFNRLENMVTNTIADLTQANEETIEETKRLNREHSGYVDEKIRTVTKEIDNNNNRVNDLSTQVDNTIDQVNTIVSEAVDEMMTTNPFVTTFRPDGSVITEYDNGTTDLVEFLDDGSIKTTMNRGDKGTKVIRVIFNTDSTITQEVTVTGGK